MRRLRGNADVSTIPDLGNANVGNHAHHCNGHATKACSFFFYHNHRDFAALHKTSLTVLHSVAQRIEESEELQHETIPIGIPVIRHHRTKRQAHRKCPRSH